MRLLFICIIQNAVKIYLKEIFIATFKVTDRYLNYYIKLLLK